MPDDYSKHLEKRKKEMRERMVKSKLDRARKRKYWKCRFNKEVKKLEKKKSFLQRFGRKKVKEEGRIVPRHKIKLDKDKKK